MKKYLKMFASRGMVALLVIVALATAIDSHDEAVAKEARAENAGKMLAGQPLLQLDGIELEIGPVYCLFDNSAESTDEPKSWKVNQQYMVNAGMRWKEWFGLPGKLADDGITVEIVFPQVVKAGKTGVITLKTVGNFGIEAQTYALEADEDLAFAAQAGFWDSVVLCFMFGFCSGF